MGQTPKKIVIAIVILGLIMGACLFLARPLRFTGNAEAPVTFTLPPLLGTYAGESIYFCLNDQCARYCTLTDLLQNHQDEPFFCLSCNGTNALSANSIGEKLLLPVGTPIVRKIYQNLQSTAIQTTFVFSGTERESIHRPERCLIAQGNRIIDSFVYNAQATPDRRIPVRILKVMTDLRDPDGKVTASHPSVYAYWFFSPRRETCSHTRRLLLTAYDNAVHSYRPRWAYVSLAMPINPDDHDSYKAVLDDFIPHLYPLIEQWRTDARAAEIEKAEGNE